MAKILPSDAVPRIEAASGKASGAPSASRRAALGKLGGLSLLGLLGSSLAARSSAEVLSSAAGCALIPQETPGPYPLLGALGNPALLRQEIRGGKPGVPLTLTLAITDVGNKCAPVTNAAVYLWHCDKDGQYSGYDSAENGRHANETFLRGVQVTGADGKVSFSTIFPGWYAGRITHVHVQIYPNNNLQAAAILTTQFTFPSEVVNAVYGTAQYKARGQNTSVTALKDDPVFSNGYAHQVATVSGDVESGLTAALDIGIAA